MQRSLPYSLQAKRCRLGVRSQVHGISNSQSGQRPRTSKSSTNRPKKIQVNNLSIFKNYYFLRFLNLLLNTFFRPVITNAAAKLPDPMARMGSSSSVSGGGYRPRRTEASATAGSLNGRSRRQLLTSADPAYGFSNYFKPVILQPHDTSDSMVGILIGIIFLILLAIVGAGTVVYFLHK